MRQRQQSNSPPVMRDQRHLHVLDHGHRAVGRGDLERPPDPLPPDPARRQARDRLARSSRTRAARGAQLTHQHVETGGLARAVRADQRQDLALARARRTRRPRPGSPPKELGSDAAPPGPRSSLALRGVQEADAFAQLAEGADDALGREDHDAMISRPSTSRQYSNRVRQSLHRLERRAADPAARERLDPAEEHHDQRVEASARSRARWERRCPWRRRTARPRRPPSPRQRRRRPIACACASMPDRLGLTRAIPCRAQRVAEGRVRGMAQQQDAAGAEHQRQLEIDRVRRSPGRGPDVHDPVVAPGDVAPLEDEATRAVCAKASVSMAK